MNIAVFTKSLERGGAEKQSVLLTSAISDAHNVALIIWNGDKPNYYDYLIDNTKHDVYFLKGNFIKKIFNLVGVLKKRKTEVLFCYLLSTNIIGTITGKISGIKYIIGGIRNSYHPKWKEVLLRIIHNNFTYQTITNSYSSIKNLKKQKYLSEKFIVIPNGIEISDNGINQIIQNEVTILTVARFVEQKDHFTAIEAVKKLLIKLEKETRSVKIKYILVGYGALEESIKAKIRRENLEDYIKIENDKNLRETFSKADIYLCSSLFEGLSNSILEAMDHSLPVVATDAGDNRMLVANEKNGYITQTKDSAALATALYELTVNPDLRIKMGEESRKMLIQNYSLPIFRERYLKFIQNLNSSESLQLDHISAG